MRILLEQAHGPNPAGRPAKLDPKALEPCSWAAHQICYGSFVGLGASNGLGFARVVRQHLNVEPSEGIGSEFHGIGLEAVREGKVLTWNF